MKYSKSSRYIIIFSLFIIVAICLKPIQADSSEIVPKGIRLTVKNDPRNSIVITWYAEEKASNPVVSYSLDQNLASSLEAKAIEHLVEGTYIYSAELTGLSSNTKYYYQVMSDNEINEFTTAAERNVKNIEFLVLGDTQSLGDVTTDLIEKGLTKFGSNIDFVLHMGDIVDNGEAQWWYEDYFNDLEFLHSIKQCYFTEGNHEDGPFTRMYDNIPLPSNGMNSLYYSFSWGPASFLSLNDNNAELWTHTKMPTNWLEAELINFDNDKYTLWKFAYMHQPLFNSHSGRADKAELIPLWGSLFDQYGVDIIFNGHNHFYERTHPISHFGQINNSEVSNYFDPNYPIYITCNADRKMYDWSNGNSNFIPPEYVYYHNMTRQVSYIEVSIDTNLKITTLSYESWAIPTLPDKVYGDLILIDEFTITKNISEKYLDAAYQTPTLISHDRLPEFIYFILSFGIAGLLVVLLNFKILNRYFKHEFNEIKNMADLEGDRKNEEMLPFKKNILSFGIFLIIIVALSYLLISLDFLDEIYTIAIAIFASFLLWIPVNYLLGGKKKALGTFSHLGLFFGLILIIAMIVLFNNYFFYFPILNIILISIAIGFTYLANYLSKHISPSKISGKDSFYLGGSLITFEILLFFYSTMNLIALI